MEEKNTDEARSEQIEAPKSASKYKTRTDILRYEDVIHPKKAAKSEESEGFISRGALSLGALAAIVLVAVFCALRHVPMDIISLPALGLTIAIMVLMGVFLSSSPLYVTVLVAAAALILGAALGMYAEVLTGVTVCFGTVMTIREMNELGNE